MAIKVLWVSRHRPTLSQLEALRERYGRDVVINLESRPFDDARWIASAFVRVATMTWSLQLHSR